MYCLLFGSLGCNLILIYVLYYAHLHKLKVCFNVQMSFRFVRRVALSELLFLRGFFLLICQNVRVVNMRVTRPITPTESRLF